MDSASIIYAAEQALGKVKPTILVDLLVKLYHGPNTVNFIKTAVQLLELYDLFWTLDLDKLIGFKDTIFAFIKMLPTMCKDFGTFVGFCDSHGLSEQGFFDAPFDTIKDFLNNNGCVASEWSKPVCVVVTGVLIVAGSVGAGLGLSMTNIGKKLTNFVKSLGTVFKNTEWIFSGIKQLYNLVMSGLGALFGFEVDTPSGRKLRLVNKISEKIEILENYRRQCEIDMAEVMLDATMFERITVDMKDIDKMYSDVAESDSNMSNVKTLLDKLRDLHAMLNEQRQDILSGIAGKQQPAVVWIAGETGVGKSRMISDLLQHLAHLENGGKRPLTKYTRSIGDKYWSRYCGQDVVIYDDFGSCKEDLDHFELNQIYTPSSFALNCAEIGNKGKSFSSRYVIICSNFYFIERSQSIQNPEILNRRRDLLISMRSPDLVDYKQKHNAMPPASWYKDDWQHVEFEEVPILPCNGTYDPSKVKKTNWRSIAPYIYAKQLQNRIEFKHHLDASLKAYKITSGDSSVQNSVSAVSSASFSTSSSMSEHGMPARNWMSAAGIIDDPDMSDEERRDFEYHHDDWVQEVLPAHKVNQIIWEMYDTDAPLSDASDYLLQEQCILKTPGGFIVDRVVSFGDVEEIPIPSDQVWMFGQEYSQIPIVKPKKLTAEKAARKARILHRELTDPYVHSALRLHRHRKRFVEGAKENPEDQHYVMSVQDDVDQTDMNVIEQGNMYRDLYQLPEIMPVRPTGRILQPFFRESENELTEQGLSDCVREINVPRIPITILRGLPGTGKTFTLRMLAQIHGVTIISKDPTVEDLAQSVLLFDEVALNEQTFLTFLETVWEHYDNPKCLRIVATCNATSLEQCLSFYDKDKREAFNRRVEIVDFQFRKRNAFCRFKRSDITALNIDRCVKRVANKCAYTNAELLKMLTPLPTLADYSMIHTAIMKLPLSWFSHHIKIAIPFDEFYQGAIDSTTNFVKFGRFMKGKFTVEKGSPLETLRLAIKIFGAFHDFDYADRSTFERAVLAFNNLNICFESEFQAKIEFVDMDFVFCSPKGKPCIGAFVDNNVEYSKGDDCVYEREGSNLNRLTGRVASVARCYILDFSQEVREMRALVLQEQQELAESLPFMEKFKNFFRGLFLLLKFGGSMALVALSNRKKKKPKMNVEGWGSDCEDYNAQPDLPSWNAPVEHHFVNAKTPLSATKPKYEWVYDPVSRTWIRVLIVEEEAKRGFLGIYDEAEVPQVSRRLSLEACNQYAGPSSFLSNFYTQSFELWGITFVNAEQAYQYRKAMDCQMPEAAKAILQEKDPYKIKNLGKKISPTPEWLNYRAKIMEVILRAKFANTELRDKLRETAPLELLHNVHDGYWGAPGRNVHGRILMKIRFGLTLDEEYDSGLDYWQGFDQKAWLKKNPRVDNLKKEDDDQDSLYPGSSCSSSMEKRKVVKHRFKLGEEAMSDPQAAQCLDLCAQNSVNLYRNGDFCCYGLMVKGHIGVTVGHCARGHETGKVNLMVRVNNESFDIEIIKVNQTRDFCVFRVDKRCKQFKDITSQFATNAMLQADLSGNPAVLQTTKQSSRLPLQQQRVIYIRAVVTRTIDGYEKYGVEYEGHLDHYEYSPMLTQKGDCGSPIILLNPAYQRKIIGLHAAGSTVTGFSSLLTLDMFEAALTEEAGEQHEINILKHQNITRTIEDDYLKFKIIGKCVTDTGEQVPMYLPTKSRIWKSPFHLDIEGCAQFEPAILGQFDRRLKEGIDPYAEAMDKWSHEQPTKIDMDLLERCVDDIAEHLATTIKGQHLEVQVLTKNQSLNRYTKIHCSNPLHRQSSPGYPFRFWPGVEQKKTFLDQGTDGLWHISANEHGRRLHNCIDALIDNARHGIRTGVVFSGALKDEPLKLKKIYDVCKTRSFAGSPLDYTIAHRMYFHAAAAAIAEVRGLCPPQVGIDPRTSEWDSLFRRLTQVSPYGFDADFASWDATVPRVVMEQLPIVYNRIYKYNDPKWCPEDDQIRTTLHSHLHGPLMTYYGRVVQAPGGQVSGQPCTAIDNCIINMIYMFYVWMRLASVHDKQKANYPLFCKYVAYAVYGDDNITAVNEKVLPWFNFATFKKECEESLNVSVTSAAKDDSDRPYKPINELEFLKRNFVRRGKYWTGPIVKDSLVKMMGWTRTRKLHFADKDLDKVHFDMDTIGQTVECVLEEACFHERDFFEMLKKHCMDRCLQYNIAMPVTYSYDAYFDRVFFNKNVSKEYNPSSF
nr:MAG: RNA-dependent RNA polymerase [Wufeng shrew picorna-like virus 8]